MSLHFVRKFERYSKSPPRAPRARSFASGEGQARAPSFCAVLKRNSRAAAVPPGGAWPSPARDGPAAWSIQRRTGAAGWCSLGCFWAFLLTFSELHLSCLSGIWPRRLPARFGDFGFDTNFAGRSSQAEESHSAPRPARRQDGFRRGADTVWPEPAPLRRRQSPGGGDCAGARLRGSSPSPRERLLSAHSLPPIAGYERAADSGRTAPEVRTQGSRSSHFSLSTAGET